MFNQHSNLIKKSLIFVQIVKLLNIDFDSTIGIIEDLVERGLKSELQMSAHRVL